MHCSYLDPAILFYLQSKGFSAEDLDRALTAAEAGFSEWRQTGTWERAARIRKVADLIRERLDTIATV